MKIGGDQRFILKETLQKYNFEKLEGEVYTAHKKEFKPQLRDKLISEWEKNTGKEWPKYDRDSDKLNKKSEPIYRRNQPYQAHHIIHQSHGGPHEWWNMHPAHIDKHVKEIHKSGSPGQKLHDKK